MTIFRNFLLLKLLKNMFVSLIGKKIHMLILAVLTEAVILIILLSSLRLWCNKNTELKKMVVRTGAVM